MKTLKILFLISLIILPSSLIAQSKNAPKRETKQTDKVSSGYYPELFSPIIPPSGGNCNDPESVCACGYKYLMREGCWCFTGEIFCISVEGFFSCSYPQNCPRQPPVDPPNTCDSPCPIAGW